VSGRLRTEGDGKVDSSCALVKPGGIVVGVAVCGRAVAMDQIHVLRVDDRSAAALVRGDRWSRATEIHARAGHFVFSESVRRREVPLFARGQASHALSISEHSQIADAVNFVCRALVEGYGTVGGYAGASRLTGHNACRQTIPVNQADVVKRVAVGLNGKLELSVGRGLATVWGTRRRRLTEQTIVTAVVALNLRPHSPGCPSTGPDVERKDASGVHPGVLGRKLGISVAGNPNCKRTLVSHSNISSSAQLNQPNPDENYKQLHIAFSLRLASV